MSTISIVVGTTRFEPFVGYGDDAHVGLDRTEGEICRLRLGVRQAVEQGRFADVGQTDDSAL